MPTWLIRASRRGEPEASTNLGRPIIRLTALSWGLRRARKLAERASIHNSLIPPARLAEALADAGLYHVLEMHDAKHAPVAGDDQRRAAGAGDVLDHALEPHGLGAIGLGEDRVLRPLTHLAGSEVGAAGRQHAARRQGHARRGDRPTDPIAVVAAAIAALKQHPMVNSSWSDQGVVLHRAINLGIAVSLGDEGLIVPVIKNADSMNLLGLARAVNDLSDRARRKQLKPDDVQGGTFTITNHGTSGSLFATPIINQPQCGILGVGKIEKRVVVVTQTGVDSIAIKPMVFIGLTFDHRILDGNSADNFVATIKQVLESWA